MVTTLLLIAALTGQAQVPEMRDCLYGTAEARLAACSTRIDSGRLKGFELAWSYETRARIKVSLGDLNGAMSDYSRALEIDPDYQPAYDGRGYARYLRNDLEGALADLDRSLRIRPVASSHNNRGLVRIRLGDLDLALADFTVAIELEPSLARAYSNRGRVKGERRDPSALDDLNKALELDPDLVEAYSNRGLVKSTLNDLAGARADFDRALKLNPRSVEALTNRGGLKRRMGDLAGADADLTAAIAVAPQQPHSYANRALVRQAQGNLAGAMEDASTGLALAPGGWGFHLLVGDVHRDLENLPAALEAYTRAIDLSSAPDALNARGIVHSDMGNFELAFSDFREALKREPTRDYTLLRIWLVQSRLGRRAEATEELRTIIPIRRIAGASEWILTIKRFLIGEVNEEALLNAAANAAGELRVDRECQAFFYAGWVRIVDGDLAGAKSLFERAVATGRTRMLEYGSAKAELAPRQSVMPEASASTPVEVTYCDLKATPKRFANARVRITAWINFAFENFTMFDPACTPPPGSRFDAWVTYGGAMSSGAVYCCPGEGVPRQGALSFPLVDDGMLRRFRDFLAQKRDLVVKLTAVGTVLLRPDPKTPLERTMGTGYGHFGCCDLFVIEQVHAFDAHDRKDLDYSSTAGFYEGECGDSHGWSWDLEAAFGRRSVINRALAEQREAEAGERAWAFSDPHRVALEAVRAVRGSAATRLQRKKSQPGYQVYEWSGGGRKTTVVVTKPAWLADSARSSSVAWFVTAMKTCH